MKLTVQNMVELAGILALISAPFTAAESRSSGRELQNPNCSIQVGEKRNENAKQKKHKVTVNLPPQACGDSDTVNIDIPHNNVNRSFKKLKSKPNQGNGNGNGNGNNNGNNNGTNKKMTSYWYGEDEVDGSSFNYVQDEDGNMHGSLIDLTTDSVMQFTIEDGIPIVVTTGSSDFKEERDSPKAPKSRKLFSDSTVSTTDAEVHESARSYLKINDSPSTNQDQNERALLDDLGGNLDVMVVWTSRAECKNYGLPADCTPTDSTKAAMEARIDLAIEETNTAYEFSGVQTRLFLAHAYRHPTYIETFGMSDTLNALRYGQIAGTEDNRALYGADIVAMIADDPSYCGIGYIGPRIDLMYSVTAWDCSTGYFSFGHEIGHNLGLRHDRGTSNGCTKLTKYHYGYRDPQARFRTILAYDCVQGQCDNNPGGGCTRIQRFSSPTATYDGLAVGTDLENNAKKINRVRKTIALYFPHGGVVITGAPTVSPVAALTAPPTVSPVALTAAPTVSPAAAPSASPSQSPVALPPSCNDSPLEFIYAGQSMFCATIDSENLCSDAEIQAICPATCETCSNCVDPTLQIIYYNPKKALWQTKDCVAVAKNPPARCAFDGVSDTCRVTCGTC